MLLVKSVSRSGSSAKRTRKNSSGKMERATIEEWLLAAEYILSHGNRDVILCERGIRSYETATRFTFDINAIPVIKRLSHLPIMGDPSHATGKWYLVPPIALAAVAAGGGGLMIAVHPNPDHALSGG